MITVELFPSQNGAHTKVVPLSNKKKHDLGSLSSEVDYDGEDGERYRFRVRLGNLISTIEALNEFPCSADLTIKMNRDMEMQNITEGHVWAHTHSALVSVEQAVKDIEKRAGKLLSRIKPMSYPCTVRLRYVLRVPIISGAENKSA